MVAKVTYVRPEVQELMPKWQLVRDCLCQDAVKRAGTTYLPMPDADDKSVANQERYKSYKERAVFYNVTARTLNGMVGQVFSVDPTVTLPPLLELMEEDVDGGGVALDQQSKQATEHVLSYGRAGLLADYPRTERAASKAEIDAGKIRPTLVLYEPTCIPNWRVVTIGGQKLLSMVVLQEEDIVADDGFEIKCEVQYRVLRLNTDNPRLPFYYVQIWKKAMEDNKEVWIVTDEFMPLDSSGKAFQVIPFTFIGVMNNDPQPDEAPLYDIADLNVAHYRNSADYEESCFILGQPTLFISGLTQNWVKDVWKDREIKMGSRAAITAPAGASAQLLQVQPNTMVKEAMDQKEKQMVALGAKLVEQSQVVKTLGEASMEEASELSILQAAAKNVSTAYEQALSWAAQYIGAPEDGIEYELSTDFAISRMSPLERAQLMAEWQGNAISFSEMRFQLRQSGIATLDDEKAKEEIASEGPSLNLDGDTGAVDANGNPIPPNPPPAGNKDKVPGPAAGGV